MYCKSYPVLFVYQIVIFVMKKIKLFFISKYEGKYSSVIMIKKKIVERDVKYDQIEVRTQVGLPMGEVLLLIVWIIFVGLTCFVILQEYSLFIIISLQLMLNQINRFEGNLLVCLVLVINSFRSFGVVQMQEIKMKITVFEVDFIIFCLLVLVVIVLRN